MQRVVLDTNVFISGLLTPDGTAALALDAWRERRFLLVTSPGMIAEVARVLRYPRLQQKYGITEEEIEALITLLESEALIVPGQTPIERTIPNDPSDEMFLACALEADADCIVSGDQHLLALNAFRGIPILTVRAFLERLGAD